MSDHEFEKQVRQKLHDLKIKPSPAAWENIEHAVKPRPNRLRWLWMAVFLAGMSAAGFYLLNNDRQSNSIIADTGPTVQTPDKPQLSTQQHALKGSDLVQTPTLPPARGNDRAGNISKTQEDVQEEIKKTIASPDSRSDNRTTDKASLGALVLTGPVKRDDRKAGGKKPGSTVVSSIPTAVAGKATTKARKLPAATDAISRVVPPDAGNPAGSTVSTAPAGVKMVEPAPEVVSAPAAAEISSTPEIRKGSKKQSKKKKWSFGVQGSAGITHVNEGKVLDFNRPLVQDVSFTPTQAASSPSWAPSPTWAPQYKPSMISPGFSFSAGGFAELELSRRFSVSGGLNYQQLNTRTKVGERGFGSQVVNNGQRGYLSVVNFYTVQQDNPTEYRNRYHFLAVPIELHTRLNPDRSVPVFFNTGITVSTLLSSTSLHFDGTTGVYYHDDNLLNRIQTAATMGFSVSLFNRSKTPVHIGPTARYYLSDILEKDVSASKSFVTGALNIRMFLR